MKKRIQTFFFISSALYWGIYLGICFTLWQWRNPFQWIIDLPTYEYQERLCIVTLIVCWGVVFGLTVHGLNTEEKTGGGGGNSK